MNEMHEGKKEGGELLNLDWVANVVYVSEANTEFIPIR